MGRLDLEIDYMFLQWVLIFVTPTVAIDGFPQKRKWGRHFFDLPAGNHHLHVSYPYLFSSRCNPADVVVPIYPGMVTRMRYDTALFVFSNGSLRTLGTFPAAPQLGY